MLNFEYENPTKILFGNDSLEKLGNEILHYGKTVLLVYGGGSVNASGNYEKITASLKTSGIQWVDFGGNKIPDISAISKGVKLCREHGIDVVIGIGGGVCMDLAKGIGCHGALSRIKLFFGCRADCLRCCYRIGTVDGIICCQS